MKKLIPILLPKIKYLFFLLAAFLAPVTNALIAIGVLICIDFILALISTKKTGEKITSRKMSQSIIKLLVYYLLIISAFITETYLMPFAPVVKLTLGFLGMVEFLSIGESFTKITGLPFIKFIKDKLMNSLKKYSDGKQ